jgi:hypothetical protein
MIAKRPNSTQKLARPGFGPAAEPPRAAPAWRRHAACIARLTCRQAARRVGFGIWALAAQLSAFTVRRAASLLHEPPPDPDARSSIDSVRRADRDTKRPDSLAGQIKAARGGARPKSPETEPRG